MTGIEQAALSSLLNGGWHYGGHILAPEDFTDQRNRAVFMAIRQCAQEGDVDLFAVAAKLDFDIDYLLQVHAGAKGIRGYAETLKDETLKRELQKAAITIQAGQGAGKEQLLQAQSLLASLQGMTGGEIKHIGEHLGGWWQELGDRAEGGEWLNTRFPDVDRRLGGMRGGDLIILAGRPSMGKTAFALNVAVQCEQPTAFFSLEMSVSNLMDRLSASLSGVGLGDIRMPQKLDDQGWQAVTKATERIKQLPLYLDDTPALSIEEIHARARSLKAKEGLSLVMVDYLQLVESDTRMSREQQVSHVSRMGKRMAKDLDVPVILLAQLSRKCEERQDKRPIMSDLRDSGAIEQDADVVGFIYRDEVYDENSPKKGYAELIFRKVRQGETGSAWFLFDGPHQTFKQTDKPDEPERKATGPYLKEWGK